MLFCVAVLPVINVSKYLSRTLSTNAGSAILTVRINIKVMIAVQGLTHFIIWVFIVLVALIHSGSAATTQSDTISSDVVGLPAGLCEIHSRWTTYVVDHYSGLVLCVA